MLPRAAALRNRTRSVDLTGRRTATRALPSVPSSPTSRAHAVSLLKGPQSVSHEPIIVTYPIVFHKVSVDGVRLP